ncbi:MAG: hypothetical protein HW421_2058 [Ignavibacteria bacterium]|nr:hypothetical protein [Ignavibacteria bacterium]
MSTITIEVPQSKEKLLISILQDLPYVNIKTGKTKTPEKTVSKEKQKILDGIRQGFKEAKLIEEGKLEAIPYDEFMKELRDEK